MIPDRYAPRIYSVFRFVFGLMFLSHGLQKLFGMFGGLALFGGRLPPLTSEPGIAGLIELVLGSLIMVGWFTRFCFAFLYMSARGAGPWSIDERMMKRNGRAKWL
jgi:putative oxidoreductase